MAFKRVLHHLPSALAFGGSDGAGGVHQQDALGQDGLAEALSNGHFDGIASLEPFSGPNDASQCNDDTRVETRVVAKKVLEP